MLNNIQIFKYIETKSIIHEVDSLNKLLTLIIFTLISFKNNIFIHLVLLIYLFILIILSKIKLLIYLKSIKNIIYLLTAVFLINIVCKVDIVLNIINLFRIIEIVIYSSIITMTTKTNELISGLYRLLLPLKLFKINIKKIVFILTMAIKFIFIIIDEFNKIIKGLISKGIKTKNKILVLKSIIIPTISLSLRQSDALANDLDFKLYNYDDIEIINAWKIIDTIILIIYIITLILIWR